ncbi:hypothetical protein LTR67_000009 [Exophiala xenobiotica]
MRKSKYRYPPGPKGIPIFGNLFQLPPKYPSAQLMEWGKQYGDIGLNTDWNRVLTATSGSQFNSAREDGSFSTLWRQLENFLTAAEGCTSAAQSFRSPRTFSLGGTGLS